MKRKISFILLSILLLSGCTAKTGENTQTNESGDITKEAAAEETTDLTDLTEGFSEVSTVEKPQELQEAEAEAEKLKKKYGDRLFVSYDTAYAVGFPDEEWSGVEDDTTTTFEKDDMVITSVHLDEVDLPVFGDIKEAMPKTKTELQNQYSSKESTQGYVVKEFEMTEEGDFVCSYAVSEINDEEYNYIVTRTIASDTHAYIISGYCNTDDEIEEISDIILNNYFIF